MLEAVEGYGAAAEAAERALLRYNEEVTGWGGGEGGSRVVPAATPRSSAHRSCCLALLFHCTCGVRAVVRAVLRPAGT